MTSAAGAVTSAATDGFDAEIDRVRDLLPPLPGRTRAVTKVVEGLGTVALAALEQSGEQRLDTREVAREIVYRGLLGREKSLRAQLFTTAPLAQQPEVVHSLVVTAESMGGTGPPGGAGAAGGRGGRAGARAAAPYGRGGGTAGGGRGGRGRERGRGR
ncbi:hypothetical protein HUT19_36725 [Streptomyces sp. NA02950]|uniref:hypothetical protein n=1 Tax=Streptomyces sp. NA02950 TaxID=2742137 RepID=UPI001590DA5E|nr:hypothetical protein [Streptomyces sp. NA02950]QKV96559.1 hypothetical protein HUT19_36725 [Streptomyces sp. NA02950]